MEQIRTPDRYKELVREVKDRFGKPDKNSILMAGALAPVIEEGRLWGETFPRGTVFFQDEGRYYNLYYYWEPGAALPDLRRDKPVLIEELDNNGARRAYIESFEPRLEAAGFRLFKTNLQLEADLTDLGYPLEEELARRLETLAERGLSLRYCDETLLPQVRRLWEEHLDPTDFPWEHLAPEEGARLLCVVDQSGRVAAVKWWKCDRRTQEGRHTVTDPAYYRQGLGTTLLLAQFRFAREQGMTRNITWVSDVNTRSLAMCRKVGLVPNGRVSKQYILQ